MASAKRLLLTGSALAGVAGLLALSAPAQAFAQGVPSGQSGSTTTDRVEAGQASGKGAPDSAPTATAPQITAEPGQAPAARTEGGAQVGEVVVTGTRIRSVNLQSGVPITSLSAATFTNTAQISIGDVLNELPALRSTFSTANSTRFIGTSGLNLLDLRGLGTSRTLVLVNGKRHVSASEGSSEVDTNTIPTDLIDHVDVVTGGNSAIYGSDAIAGVVNFVLKHDFEGLILRGQEGISDRSDGNAYFLSATAGKNFDGGRGNIALSAEYAKTDSIQIVDRENTRNRGGFLVV